MLPLNHALSVRLTAGRFIGRTAVCRDAIITARLNPLVNFPIVKRFKMDYPGDPPSSQKPMDPRQTGGHGDIIINQNITRKTPPKTVEDFKNPDLTKFWVSYGYDYFNQKADRFMNHYYSFLFGTVMVAGFFLTRWFRADEELNNWAVREAFIEIKRREELGLPYVDCNYIPPEKVRLPTEEELQGRHVYY